MSAVAPARILVVDDQPLVRTGLRLLLEQEPGWTVVGEAGDGVTALAHVTRLRPDVVLLDLQMPRLDGVATLQAVRRDGPSELRVLVLTVFDDDRAVYAALRAGADGYVLKRAEPERIVAAVRSVLAGDQVVPPEVLRMLLADAVGARRHREQRVAALDVLSPREREVLAMVAAGHSDADIAARLSVTAGSVKTYVHRVIRKLGVSTRVQAVAVAYEAGLSGR